MTGKLATCYLCRPGRANRSILAIALRPVSSISVITVCRGLELTGLPDMNGDRPVSSFCVSKFEIASMSGNPVG
jgi:hypothetical protein